MPESRPPTQSTRTRFARLLLLVALLAAIVAPVVYVTGIACNQTPTSRPANDDEWRQLTPEDQREITLERLQWYTRPSADPNDAIWSNVNSNARKAIELLTAKPIDTKQFPFILVPPVLVGGRPYEEIFQLTAKFIALPQDVHVTLKSKNGWQSDRLLIKPEWQSWINPIAVIVTARAAASTVEEEAHERAAGDFLRPVPLVRIPPEALDAGFSMQIETDNSRSDWIEVRDFSDLYSLCELARADVDVYVRGISADKYEGKFARIKHDSPEFLQRFVDRAVGGSAERRDAIAAPLTTDLPHEGPCNFDKPQHLCAVVNPNVGEAGQCLVTFFWLQSGRPPWRFFLRGKDEERAEYVLTVNWHTRTEGNLSDHLLCIYSILIVGDDSEQAPADIADWIGGTLEIPGFSPSWLSACGLMTEDGTEVPAERIFVVEPTNDD